jgi:hypothetical protein
MDEAQQAFPCSLHADSRFLVERFFRDISERKVRRGVFRSADELVKAITDYVAHHNQNLSHSSGPLLPLTSWRKSNALEKSSISYSLYDGLH